MEPSAGLVCVYVAQGQMQAHVFKARLESAGVPVLLRYESLGLVYGFTLDGLGEVGLYVPAALADEARYLLEHPEPLAEGDWAGTSKIPESPAG